MSVTRVMREAAVRAARPRTPTEKIREGIAALRDDCDLVLRTGPLITRAETERVILTARLTSAMMEREMGGLADPARMRWRR